MLEASARARAHARCAMRRAASWLTAVRRAASWLTAVRRAASWLTAVRRCSSSPSVRRAAQVRPCGVRRCSSSPSMQRCGVRHVTCESIRARHTVAPYWLTLVRRTRHSRTHAPCSQPRASCIRARMRMTATSCAALPTTWSLQPLCFTTRARSKIQRRLSSGSRRCERAKCKVRHQSATLRLIAHATRARARACASASAS
ncbi:hypothetical protein HanXRQr2_Chr14g0625081 [Helianthus annuus]|uniref:Uncharacterized protein n=1 Tax=Helianthus annuus TaxID=4232 RepID=A0A9K3E6V1_HELAN|nr:hypothetical protein HanXRQr2_Chr14g0625081 [Helianthus annuus]KAJ0463041.1 hypothetical protein HanHA300_Chr14g0510751 [Helianthus annuus]KAJ0484403.1 hypothetical protein HanHA89_Chr14g0543701 [Helianthus annuus]KAJ0654955.1 hypothetical protein HanLR1_Chr14g0512961 [Helianthus annuus]